jgi:hypothetical protein
MLNILGVKEMQITTMLRFHLTPVSGCHQEHKEQMLVKFGDKGTLMHFGGNVN